MTKQISSRMGNGILVAAGLLLGAMIPAFPAAAQQPGALPGLPSVQYEGAADTPAVAAPPASPASPAAPGAGAPGPFSSKEEAQDKLRSAFSQGNYSGVLGLIAEIRRQYPDETFTGYYESSARLQIQESKIDPAKRPFPSLDLKAIKTPVPPHPTASPTPQESAAPTAVPSPSPAATAAQGGTPKATPTPAEARATPASSASRVAAPAPAAPAPARGRLLDRLAAAWRANPTPFLIGGGACLVLLAVGALALRRRRVPAAEAEELEPAYGAQDELPAALPNDDFPTDPLFAAPEFPEPAAERPAMPGPTLAPGGLARILEFEQTPPAAPPDVLPPEATAEPDFGPVFTLPGDADLPTVGAPSPVAPADGPLTPDVISFDDKSFALEPESLPAFDPHELDARLTLGPAPASLPPEAGFTFTDDATLTGGAYPGAGELTQAGATMREETRATPADETGSGDFQAFHPGETVTINWQAEAEPPVEPPDPERTRLSEPPPVARETPKVNGADGMDDVFEREYKQGLKDMDERNWVGAIHHLSIAAALRPGALEVKERLREVRRMRAKELEGRG